MIDVVVDGVSIGYLNRKVSGKNLSIAYYAPDAFCYGSSASALEAVEVQEKRFEIRERRVSFEIPEYTSVTENGVMFRAGMQQHPPFAEVTHDRMMANASIRYTAKWSAIEVLTEDAEFLFDLGDFEPV